MEVYCFFLVQFAVRVSFAMPTRPKYMLGRLCSYVHVYFAGGLVVASSSLIYVQSLPTCMEVCSYIRSSFAVCTKNPLHPPSTSTLRFSRRLFSRARVHSIRVTPYIPYLVSGMCFSCIYPCCYFFSFATSLCLSVRLSPFLSLSLSHRRRLLPFPGRDQHVRKAGAGGACSRGAGEGLSSYAHPSAPPRQEMPQVSV